MKKVIIAILAVLTIGGIIFASISAYRNNSMKTIYEEAIVAADNKDFKKAKELFSELPADYQYEKKAWKTITARDWVESIDKCVDSPFIGEWKAKNSLGSWKINIHISSLDFKGVYIAYSKSYTSPSGVKLGDFGDLYIYNDGVTVAYTNTNESNASHYRLKLVNSNTIELYFDNKLEVTLHK